MIKLKGDSTRLWRLTKESFWIATGQCSAVVAALVGVRILTEWMNPTQYGQLALGMTLATLFGQAWLGPLSAGTARFFAAASEAGELRSYSRGIFQLIAVINRVLLLLIVFVISAAMFGDLKEWLPLFIAALLFATVSGYNNIASGIQNAARQRAIVALHSGVTAWARLGIAVVLILIFGVSSAAVIGGYAIATVLVLGSQYYFLRPVIHSGSEQAPDASSRIWKRRILSYSWPFATWGVFTAIHLASDRWALAAFSSQADVGLFSVLYQLGYYPVALFTEMLYALITPVIFQRAGDGASVERLNNAARLNLKIVIIVLGVTVLIFIASWLAHELIFRIFVAQAYASVSYFLPWVTLSAGIMTAGHLLSLTRMSGLDTKALILPKVTTAVVGVLLNVLAAYWNGLQGVVAAQLLLSIIYFAWMFFQYLNYSRNLSYTGST